MLVPIRIEDGPNYTVTFSNDLGKTVKTFQRASYVQFGFDENNRNSAVSLELIFDIAFGCDPTL